MGFFSNMYTKEGPGVPKNAPQKKGVARFFEIVMRDTGMLWKAGVLTSLCIAPAIIAAGFTVLSYPYLIMIAIGIVLYLIASMLVGPAMCALHAIVITTVRDIPCYMMHEYKKAWKSNWKQSVPLGVITMALYGIELYTGYFILTNESSMQYLMLGFVMLCLFLITSVSILTFLQILFIDLNLTAMLKNSLLMTFGFAKRTLPAGIIAIAVAVAVLGFVPWALWPIAMVLGVIAFATVIIDMWAWPVLETAFKITEQQKAREEERLAQEN